MFEEAKLEPVTVPHYGRPSVMIVPLELGQEAARYHNARHFAAFLNAMPPAHADAPNLTMEELNALNKDDQKNTPRFCPTSHLAVRISIRSFTIVSIGRFGLFLGV